MEILIGLREISFNITYRCMKQAHPEFTGMSRHLKSDMVRRLVVIVLKFSLTLSTVGVDMIPNVAGYPPECLFDTPFILPGNKAIQFYTNDCEGVVDLHFKMMADHGISGAFLQRFYGYINEANGGWINVRTI